MADNKGCFSDNAWCIEDDSSLEAEIIDEEEIELLNEQIVKEDIIDVDFRVIDDDIEKNDEKENTRDIIEEFLEWL